MPTHKHEFVQLEPGEDVASVRDRLTFLRGQHVLLIWPENGTALNRKLDLVLVQREAMRLAIRLALVTHDPAVIKQAHELNISTFETIGASERGKWKRARSHVFTDRFGRPEDDPDPDELMSVASRVRVVRKSSPMRFIARLIILMLLLGVTAAVAVLLIPSATITITPAQQRLEVEATINAQVDPESKRLDVENGIIPAIIARAQIEEHATIPTTGTQSLTDTRATGAVVFINKTNSAIRIPSGTMVSTSASTPILFHTTEDATVSAGQGLQAEVPIEAVDAAVGDVGNVGAGQINTVADAALVDQVDVLNIAPTLGGLSRSTSVVSQTDHDRLIDILRQQLQDRAYDEMLPRLEDNQFIIPDTIHIAEERSDWMTFDHEVGDAATSLTLTMRAIVEATVVDAGAAQQIAFARLAGQIPHGHVVRPETVLYERGAVTNTRSGGSVTFTMKCSGQIVTQINAGQLQQALAGRTPDDAAAIPVQRDRSRSGHDAGNRRPAGLDAAPAAAADAHHHPHAVAQRMIRLIGVDHGMARIGVAVSDRAGLTARELTIIERKSKREDFARLNALAAEHEAGAFVVGLPSDYDDPADVEFTQADRVRAWVEHFRQATPLPILLWDEQLTTVDAQAMARRLKRPPRAHVDDLAARVMLQSYLDAVHDGLAEPPAGEA